MRDELKELWQDCKSNPAAAGGTLLVVAWLAASIVPAAKDIQHTFGSGDSLSFGEILRDLD